MEIPDMDVPNLMGCHYIEVDFMFKVSQYKLNQTRLASLATYPTKNSLYPTKNPSYPKPNTSSYNIKT